LNMRTATHEKGIAQVIKDLSNPLRYNQRFDPG